MVPNASARTVRPGTPQRRHHPPSQDPSSPLSAALAGHARQPAVPATGPAPRRRAFTLIEPVVMAGNTNAAAAKLHYSLNDGTSWSTAASFGGVTTWRDVAARP